LFETIPAARKRSSAPSPASLLTHLVNLISRPVLAQSPSGRLLVIGTADRDVVRIERVLHEPGAQPLRPVPAGKFTLHLLDSAGRAVQTIPFSPARPDRAGGSADGPGSFALDVPAPAGLHAIRVTGPSGARAEIARSARPPSVRGEASREGSAVRLRWTTADADGDAVRVSVFLRGDDARWGGVMVDTARTELTLHSAQLPRGQQGTARLVANDGFNTSSTDVDLGLTAPLTAEPMTPSSGATGVPLTGDLVAWVSAPLQAPAGRAVPLQTGSLTLRRANGAAIAADVQYEPGTGLVMLTPIAPLAPATRYTATLEGVRDRQGIALAGPLTWSFVTAGAATPVRQAPGARPAASRPWTMSFVTGSRANALPDIDGTTLNALRIGAVHQLTGAHPDARISVGIPVTKALEARAYAPVRFTLTFPKRSLVCTGGRELTVTVSSADPFEARYEGAVTCRSGDGKQNFTGTVSGTLRPGARR
jgi:hypothetical protein